MDNIFEELLSCNICPRNCGVNRYEKIGYCGADAEIKAAKAFLHQWEEPCISGDRGSGTIFFSNCNLKCIFCQNHEISQESFGKRITVERLSDIFIELQEKGAHNINLVTSGHYIFHTREALLRAKKKGLNIPVVYNSSGYEKIETLRLMEGLIDIYLPDLKYYSDKLSLKYSNAPEYFKYASQAILEMYRQSGEPVFDDQGIMKKGVMIRHLMLPGHLFDSKKIVDWVITTFSNRVYLNLMCQYTPLNKACDHPEINRKINSRHYEALVDYAISIGLENGFIQEPESAAKEFVPEFNLEGI